MKKLLLLSTLALALIGATASTAQAGGYTCIYKQSGIYAVINGSENRPAFCRAFSEGGHARRVYRAYGRTRCAWQSTMFDVRVSIRTPSRLRGRLFCLLMNGRIPDGFYRVR